MILFDIKTSERNIHNEVFFGIQEKINNGNDKNAKIK